MSYFKNTPESLLEKVKEIQIKTAAREGNKFTKALMAARENGNKFFTVNGKEYETEALDDKDVAIIKKVAGKLKGASQAHAGQSKDLEKALSDEVKYPHDMFDPKTGKKEVAKNVDDHKVVLDDLRQEQSDINAELKSADAKEPPGKEKVNRLSEWLIVAITAEPTSDTAGSSLITNSVAGIVEPSLPNGLTLVQVTYTLVLISALILSLAAYFTVSPVMSIAL